MREAVKTDKAPAAVGPYSQAIKVSCGTAVFVSGIIPLNPETKEIVGKTAAEQCKQVMDNMTQVVKAAGGDLSSIARATIYLTDMDSFGPVNEMYATYFDVDPPARAACEVSALPLGVKVMIDAVAFV